MCIRDRNQIVALNPHELLVATGGKGVYKLDVDTYIAVSYTHLDVYKRQR